MFFPPSEPSVTSFAYGESKGLLPTKTVDAVRSRYESNATPSKSVISVQPDHSHIHQSGFATEQIKSQMSIVAPFATPPPSPTVPKRSNSRSFRPGHTPVQGSASGHVLSRSITSSSQVNTEGDTSGQGGSLYAWWLLADHLRLPEDALGMMGEATEMNRRGWKAARKSAENELFPGVVSQSYPIHLILHRSSLPSLKALLKTLVNDIQRHNHVQDTRLMRYVRFGTSELENHPENMNVSNRPLSKYPTLLLRL